VRTVADATSPAGIDARQVISLEEAPAAFERFEKGEAAKYVIDPHGLIRSHRAGMKA
jgi:glutathione-independent formaldehyde dehydrogenase